MSQNAELPRWRNYEFDLSGYIEAVQVKMQLEAEAAEACRKATEATKLVLEFEDKLHQAMANAIVECRRYAREGQ